jgi:hypothetical protein
MWFIAHLAFALADCPPPRMGALYGPMGTGTYSAAMCYRRKTPPFPLPMIIA